MSIGAAIRAMRIERGLRQGDLAQAAGIHAAPLCHIERGRSAPNSATLARIADALGVPASAIMARAEAGPLAAASRVAADPAEVERRRSQVRALAAASKRQPSVCVRIGRSHARRARVAAKSARISVRDWLETLIDSDAAAKPTDRD